MITAVVAITAPCAFVSATAAVIIGLVAGTLVVFSVLCFDRFRIDDPVGALSVHLTNGIWGTLAVGLFAMQSATIVAAVPANTNWKKNFAYRGMPVQPIDE